MSFLWSLISFIIAISILVFVHEYGHFWAARKCGVKVHRFSIGFGKILFAKRDKQGTEFAISAVPLGGYVQMLDERNENVPEQLKSQAFNNKTVLQRAFIIAAGPIANFIFAILAYWVIYFIGVPNVTPVIAHIEQNSIAAQAKLEPNMQIIAVDNVTTPNWETINMVLATKIGNSNVKLTVTEFGENIEQTKTLNLSTWDFDPEKETAFGALGIKPVNSIVEMKISQIIENSPAQNANLKIGDIIFNKYGDEILWEDFVQEVQKGEMLSLKIDREGTLLDIQVQPELKDGRWFIGIAPTIEPIAEKYRSELKYNLFEALQKGVEKTAQLTGLIVKIIGKLLTGDLSLNNLGGPISIAKGAGASSEIGIISYLGFLALISVNLAVMNLFPLPVLDGGHLAFLAVESVMRKPISERIQGISYRIGTLLLLALISFSLFNDFLRL